MSQLPTTSMMNQNPSTKKLLERVYRKIKAEVRAQEDETDPDIYNRVAKITGLRVNVLREISKGETIDLNNKPIDRSVIHKQLLSFYLSKNILPTTKQLFYALSPALPKHMDIASFRKLLYRMDYVWKKLGNLFVVLERPEVTYERYKFLKEISEYQDKHLPIYFVEEWIIPLDSDSHYGITETSDATGKEIIVFAFSKSQIVFTNSVLPLNRTEIDYKNWIVGELIPHLDLESVIVLNTEHFYTDLFNYPTIDSLKEEMTDWLDKHNVPYDANMPKVELWSLIEEYTDVHSKTTSLETVIRSYGHIPMRIPRHLHMLSPGTHLYELIKNKPDFFDQTLDRDQRLDNIHSKMNSIDIVVFQKCIDVVLTKYRSFLCDDIILDEKLELLMKKMESQEFEGNDGDSDLPSDSDSN